jgi:hypothetical protein
MSHGVLRRLLAGAGAAGLLSAGGIAVTSAQGGSSSRIHGKPHLSERRILRIAEQAAAGGGDRYPTLIRQREGTRHDANLIDSGDGVSGQQWSYLIAERGHFVVKDSQGLPGSTVPRGSVLTLIVNATTGHVTDFGVSDRYPDLAKLGRIYTDLRTGAGVMTDDARHAPHGDIRPVNALELRTRWGRSVDYPR